MSATTHRVNRFRWLFLGAFVVVGALCGAARAEAKIQIESFKFETIDAGGVATQQASGHPDLSVTSFDFPRANGAPLEAPKNVVVELPPGQVGAPAATPTCSQAQLETSECSAESQVGTASLTIENGGQEFEITVGLYNMKAPPGVLAQFGFLALTTSVHLVASVRSEPDYGVDITVRNTPQALPFFHVKTTFWGVPADASHDDSRFCPGPLGDKCPSDPPKVLPFLTNPSACTPTSIAVGLVDSWQDIGNFTEARAGNVNSAGHPIGITGCAAVDFQPQLELRPTTNAADSPSGLDMRIHLPQNESPAGLAEAQLKDATFDLPAGMTVNPSSAAGLDGCDPGEIGLTTPVGQSPAHFNLANSACPDASKLGTVQLATPLLTNPLQGEMYLAQPYQNPFGSLLGLYLVVEDPATGVLIKMAGKASPDSRTGKLSVSFPQNPQMPFEDLKVDLFGGSQGVLKTPLYCGTFTATSELVPWTTPEGETRHPSDAFSISRAAKGGSCPSSESTAPNHPTFIAGTTNPAAGSFSPFVLKVSREDGSQPIKGLEATLPKGLLGRLAGVPYCSDAALAAAAANSGKAEQASPSCPAASQVGTVSVAAGAGSAPLSVPGKAYLAGPYKGAPLSLAVVTPAVAGPFDLGTVVVRNALQVDPLTTQIHVVSDPIPTILQGIPLDIRQIAVNVDRPRFTVNPTHCEPAQVTGSVLSTFDQQASVVNPFAVGGCNALRFKPKLKLAFKGQTKRTGHPAVRAVLTAPAGQANIASTTVIMPRSEFIDQAHVNNPCTRVQFDENACPAKSVLGRAVAWSPLLDKPLEGPVYFRSNGGERKIPDIVADLNGQIHVDLVGFIDSVKVGREASRVRTRFAEIPDAPVSRFELQLKGGKRGLIQNSRNLCRAKPTAIVQMDGQNGRIADSKPEVRTACGKKAHGRKHRRSRHHTKR